MKQIDNISDGWTLTIFVTLVYWALSEELLALMGVL